MRNDSDIFSSGLCCDGRFYCDQGVEIVCSGEWLCDGVWTCEGFKAVRGTLSDTILTPSYLDSSLICNGSATCSGFLDIYSPQYFPDMPLFDGEEDTLEALLTLSPMEDQAVVDAQCDGDMLCDGSNLDSMIDSPMAIRIIRPFLCNGNRTVYAQTLSESLFCDESFTCDDKSWPCTDLIEEEVV
jgi:hypothetical protein